MILLFVSKKDFSLRRIKGLETEPKIKEKALEENCFIVHFSLNGKLCLQITDPVIETGDHFNIGVILESGKSPIFYGYKGSPRINIWDIASDDRYWREGPFSFMEIVNRVEELLAEEVDYAPKFRDWATHRLAA